jgi:hypothetical protein
MRFLSFVGFQGGAIELILMQALPFVKAIFIPPLPFLLPFVFLVKVV